MQSTIRKTEATSSASGSLFVGVVLTAVLTLVAAVPNYAYAPFGLHRAPTGVEYVASAIVVYLLGLLVGIAYLRASGRGLQYLDVRLPSTRGWLYAGGGTVVAILVTFGLGIATTLLALPMAQNNVLTPLVEGTVRGSLDRSIVFTAILLVIVLFASPVEEFLFRNVIQKRLAERFSAVGAIALTSILFALYHVPAYYSLTPLASVLSLVQPLLVGVVFGVLYQKTANIVVATLAHALMNAVGLGVVSLSVLSSEPVALGLL